MTHKWTWRLMAVVTLLAMMAFPLMSLSAGCRAERAEDRQFEIGEGM